MTNGNESRTFYRGKPVTCLQQAGCGVTAKDNRLFLEAVLWIARTGSLWRDMPARFGDWHGVYVRYNRWAHKGHWLRIFEALADDPDFEHLMVDGSIVRVHLPAAGRPAWRG